jgi:hypothetical protein
MKRAPPGETLQSKKQKATGQPKEIPSLQKLAGKHIPDHLLRHVAQNESVELLMVTAGQTARNVVVKGRVAYTPHSFSTSMANYPRLRVDSLDVPEFWFEFDPEQPEKAQGRLCCFKTEATFLYNPEPYDFEQSKELIRALQQDARYEILPRRGSCLYALQRDETGRWFRYDCAVHPATWLEVSVHD